jgi:hypothetical protein
MLKLIATLVMSSTLSVTVETDTGYVERDFPNTEAGAGQLIEFAETTVGNPEGGVRVVVGSLGHLNVDEPVVEALLASGVAHGVVSPADIQASSTVNGLTTPSARAVALADEERFGFLYRRKKK